jgi:hypothetical protein
MKLVPEQENVMTTAAYWDYDTCISGSWQMSVYRDEQGAVHADSAMSRKEENSGDIIIINRADGMSLQDLRDLRDACDAVLDRFASKADDLRSSLRGEYKLDDDRRIAKRYAHLRHAEEALKYHLEMGEADPPSYAGAYAQKLRQDIELLRPYWLPGVTKEQAVAAYYADQVRAGEKS